jgi:hypothetical protein
MSNEHEGSSVLYNVEAQAMRAARDGDLSKLLELLRSGFPVSKRLTAFLADLLEGKFKKPAHRAESRPGGLVATWLKKPNNWAAMTAHRYELDDGEHGSATTHREAAQKAVVQFWLQFPSAEKGPDVDQVAELLRRGRHFPQLPTKRTSPKKSPA